MRAPLPPQPPPLERWTRRLQRDWPLFALAGILLVAGVVMAWLLLWMASVPGGNWLPIHRLTFWGTVVIAIGLGAVAKVLFYAAAQLHEVVGRADLRVRWGQGLWDAESQRALLELQIANRGRRSSREFSMVVRLPEQMEMRDLKPASQRYGEREPGALPWAKEESDRPGYASWRARFTPEAGVLHPYATRPCGYVAAPLPATAPQAFELEVVLSWDERERVERLRARMVQVGDRFHITV